MTAFFIFIGVAGLGAALLALAPHQPYGVWYPLVLVGGISSFTSCWVVPLVRLRYRAAYNRRLEAEQLRRG